MLTTVASTTNDFSSQQNDISEVTESIQVWLNFYML